MPDHWRVRFLEMAEMVSSWSEDPDRKIGCVITGPDNSIRAMGFNGLARGVDGSIKPRMHRAGGEKYKWVEHAERNAIYAAARNGTPLGGCTMYLTWVPCEDCARAIIQVGIVELVTNSSNADDPIWGDRLKAAVQMLREAGVTISAELAQ